MRRNLLARCPPLTFRSRSLHRPHCSSRTPAETVWQAFRREQSRRVLWYARYPCLLWQVSASRSPTYLHRDPACHLTRPGTVKPFRSNLAVAG